MSFGSDRFRRFVADLDALAAARASEEQWLELGGARLAELVSHDDWLPGAYAKPDPARYQQYLLHRHPQATYSVVSFVWGPGQATPIHNHTVWGLVGVLRGAELAERFAATAHGTLETLGRPARLTPGDVDAVSPTVGDIHKVRNAYGDRTSISIHVYGADIGAVERSTFSATGEARPFVSGYADWPPLL